MDLSLVSLDYFDIEMHNLTKTCLSKFSGFQPRLEHNFNQFLENMFGSTYGRLCRRTRRESHCDRMLIGAAVSLTGL